jgi:hypothetical protein
MSVDEAEFQRMVLDAVSNDFEDFEMVASEVAKWSGSAVNEEHTNRIERVLMRHLADKRIRSFAPSGAQNLMIPTEANSQNIRNLWFYIKK